MSSNKPKATTKAIAKSGLFSPKPQTSAKPATTTVTQSPSAAIVSQDRGTDINKYPPKFKQPVLGDNVTPEYLADELGLAKEHRKYWDKVEGFYKEALTGRTAKLRPKTKTFTGDEFQAVFSDRSKTFYDMEAIRTEMGDKWLAKFERTTEYVQIDAKKL